MNTLCHTLRDDVLSEYEQGLVELEEEVMMDSEITLTYIQSKLQEYSLLFPSLLQLIDDIQARKVQRCE